MENNLRLDGNAAGGLLNEVFPFEMTTAEATCGACGRMKLIGDLMLYGHRLGAVLRCAHCDAALIRITHVRGSYWLDLSGMSCLQIEADIH